MWAARLRQMFALKVSVQQPQLREPNRKDVGNTCMLYISNQIGKM